jgi:hypothetical protein
MTQVIDRWDRYSIRRPITRRLRFGVLLDSLDVRAWEASCVEMLVESGLGEPGLVVLPTTDAARRTPADVLRHAAYYAARSTLWRPRAFRRAALAGFESVPVIRAGTYSDAGNWRRFSSDAIVAIRAADLDFLLRFGFGVIRGEILTAARYGVWSFHHGDERRFRGRPAGFWEMHEGAREIGVVLQRLTARLDAGVILRRGTYAVDRTSYANTLDRAYLGSIDFPLQVCRDVLNGLASELAAQPSSSVARTRRMPGTRAVARVLATTTFSALQRAVYGALVLKRWSVGSATGGGELLVEGRVTGVRWYSTPERTTFLADPFIVPGSAGRVVLCESMDYRKGHGSIVRVELSSSGVTTPTTVVVEPDAHLSYPYLILDDGDLWCTPESASTRGLTAYRLSPDARVVLARERIIEGVAAIDPTIFWYGDRWWLALTEDGPTSSSHLWIYHSARPRGPWQAHSRNPVKVDANGARGAGRPFVVNGSTYRPAQDSSSGYGRAVRIFRIIELTPGSFREESVAVLRPDPLGSHPDGLHTVSVENGSVVVDGFRDIVSPLAGWYRWAARRRQKVGPAASTPD